MTVRRLATRAGRPWGGLVHPHAVYRMYAADGELLYIGCTVDIATRVRGHMAGGCGWIYDVTRIELEWYPDFATGRAAEDRAIAAETPRCNTEGTPWLRGKPRALS